MFSDKKADSAKRLNQIATDFLSFIKEEFYDSYTYFSEKIEESVSDLLNAEKPRVMVYGIYNSGKSTLVNALCKSEVAQMADRPMTDTITEYDKGEYCLIDSPGVDAPIAHERVTEGYLEKCHVILFVISEKGMFEDGENYRRLCELIKRGTPFIIILNDRGFSAPPQMTPEERKIAKAAHEIDLNNIQHKIIKNLISESGDRQIAEKYEVVVLNAKQALNGITKEKPALYECSNVPFLEKRIVQLISSDESIVKLFKQPIANIKTCFNDAEKIITQGMIGNSTEDFGMRLHVAESKRDNIMQDLRILSKQVVDAKLDELTNAYTNLDEFGFDTVVNEIFMEIDDRYSAKINELLVYFDESFQDLNLFIDTMSNLDLTMDGLRSSLTPDALSKNVVDEPDPVAQAKIESSDFFKSRKRKEKERREQLQAQADLANKRAEYLVEEQIRRRQEARQLAETDLIQVYRKMVEIISIGIHSKYDEIMDQIRHYDETNKQRITDGERQYNAIKVFRQELLNIENIIG